ncbi:hypothetical protein VP01_659g2 [Puccinia sorghi]|uniref:Uncharacterized protein n=1 Tax=Puccinia sorghi TaxID=27349 RepID=A0A0L6UFB0_9BASI|nr:hypothetical protein VP01_659g2 [Puccinia sorghi]
MVFQIDMCWNFFIIANCDVTYFFPSLIHVVPAIIYVATASEDINLVVHTLKECCLDVRVLVSTLLILLFQVLLIINWFLELLLLPGGGELLPSGGLGIKIFPNLSQICHTCGNKKVSATLPQFPTSCGYGYSQRQAGSTAGNLLPSLQPSPKISTLGIGGSSLDVSETNLDFLAEAYIFNFWNYRQECDQNNTANPKRLADWDCPFFVFCFIFYATFFQQPLSQYRSWKHSPKQLFFLFLTNLTQTAPLPTLHIVVAKASPLAFHPNLPEKQVEYLAKPASFWGLAVFFSNKIRTNLLSQRGSSALKNRLEVGIKCQLNDWIVRTDGRKNGSEIKDWNKLREKLRKQRSQLSAVVDIFLPFIEHSKIRGKKFNERRWRVQASWFWPLVFQHRCDQVIKDCYFLGWYSKLKMGQCWESPQTISSFEPGRWTPIDYPSSSGWGIDRMLYPLHMWNLYNIEHNISNPHITPPNPVKFNICSIQLPQINHKTTHMQHTIYNMHTYHTSTVIIPSKKSFSEFLFFIHFPYFSLHTSDHLFHNVIKSRRTFQSTFMGLAVQGGCFVKHTQWRLSKWGQLAAMRPRTNAASKNVLRVIMESCVNVSTVINPAILIIIPPIYWLVIVLVLTMCAPQGVPNGGLSPASAPLYTPQLSIYILSLYHNIRLEPLYSEKTMQIIVSYLDTFHRVCTKFLCIIKVQTFWKIILLKFYSRFKPADDQGSMAVGLGQARCLAWLLRISFLKPNRPLRTRRKDVPVCACLVYSVKLATMKHAQPTTIFLHSQFPSSLFCNGPRQLRILPKQLHQ